jgi:hypothetical protein
LCFKAGASEGRELLFFWSKWLEQLKKRILVKKQPWICKHVFHWLVRPFFHFQSNKEKSLLSIHLSLHLWCMLQFLKFTCSTYEIKIKLVKIN